MLLATYQARARRRGVILLVVLALLTLFTIVGLPLVFYAASAADASRVNRESEDFPPDQIIVPLDTPESLLGAFLAQLFYDTFDTATAAGNIGVASALRGHSFGRLTFGLNTAGGNTVPYNGMGRRHYKLAAGPLATLDDYSLVNYQYFLSDALLRDPERVGDPRSGPAATQVAYNSPANVPYTYPDLNNMFLAAIKADGTVLARSFHRDWNGFG